MSEKISHWAWVGMKYPIDVKKDTKRFAESLCEACGYTLEQISQRTRKREIVDIRQQIIYVIKQRHRVTHNVIGEIFGGLDHTTITHSIIAARNHIETEPEYKERVNKLLNF